MDYPPITTERLKTALEAMEQPIEPDEADPSQPFRDMHIEGTKELAEFIVSQGVRVLEKALEGHKSGEKIDASLIAEMGIIGGIGIGFRAGVDAERGAVGAC